MSQGCVLKIILQITKLDARCLRWKMLKKKNLSTNRFTEIRAYKSKKKKKKKVKWIQWKKRHQRVEK